MNTFLRAYFPERLTARPGISRQPLVSTTFIEPCLIPTDTQERQAWLWMTQMARPSISGNGGERAVFTALCELIYGFGLAPERAAEIVHSHPFNRINPNAGRPGHVGTNEEWALHDLLRKARCAIAYPRRDGNPRGIRVCRSQRSLLVRLAR